MLTALLGVLFTILQLFTLQNVKWLNLSQNLLNRIPVQMSFLTTLRELNFEGNQVLFLPEELVCRMASSLTNLTDLNLDFNLVCGLLSSSICINGLSLFS